MPEPEFNHLSVKVDMQLAEACDIECFRRNLQALLNGYKKPGSVTMVALDLTFRI